MWMMISLVLSYGLLLQTIQDWMLSLVVLAFILIDLIILVIYTIVVGVRYSGKLGAIEIVHTENPKDVEGVRSNAVCVSYCDSI